MLRSFSPLHGILCLQVFAILIGCAGRTIMNSPEGYDLNKPEKYTLPANLAEISGIAFNQTQSDSIYAVEDENGRIYHLKPGSKEASYAKFGKKGDYEDMAFCNNYVVVLRSDGVLITFPASGLHYEEADSVQQFEGLLPKGEFEGLYADEKSRRLYILCKDCTGDTKNKDHSGFIFQLNQDGSITPSGNFNIPVKEIERSVHGKHLAFRPSGFSKHPYTKDWYIISSINKMLVVADQNWKIKNVYKLDPYLFNQPEGITFSNNANLYISNESGDGVSGNILVFRRK